MLHVIGETGAGVATWEENPLPLHLFTPGGAG